MRGYKVKYATRVMTDKGLMGVMLRDGSLGQLLYHIHLTDVCYTGMIYFG